MSRIRIGSGATLCVAKRGTVKDVALDRWSCMLVPDGATAPHYMGDVIRPWGSKSYLVHFDGQPASVPESFPSLIAAIDRIKSSC